MNLPLMHPRDQITLIMKIIYKNGMTTTSGGNISILDENGNIWITPAGIDKGSLTPNDIVCVMRNGGTEGIHAPSSEFPFHKSIYEIRPDLKAIIHAHPPALVAFSIVRQAPDINVIPQARQICGKVGYADYRLPGSKELGEVIASEFASGYNALIMENHGTVVGGSNLFKAYKRFEIFEFTARSIINSQRLGKTFSLSEQQLQAFETQDNLLPEAVITNHPSDEKSIRFEICKYVKRACEQKLMISSYGTVSMRWHDNDFLITATGVNRRFIDLEDIVQIKNGHREKGKFPSRSVRHHLEIYQRNPDINCIIFTQSPNAMAFSISHREFETRTIPESYVLLKDINTIPYGDQFKKGRGISHFVSKENPLVIIENDSILVTGNTILETFDRLEVAEFSARSLIESTTIGSMVPMNEQEIEDLKKKFLT